MILGSWAGLPKSSNLNFIEYLWGLLKRKVGRHTITSKEELKNRSHLEWNPINPEDCKRLVGALPTRISAAIKAKRGPTKY
ncbi:hypothetical protein Trydic_g21254 [Trypoxylus dichotomus]